MWVSVSEDDSQVYSRSVRWYGKAVQEVPTALNPKLRMVITEDIVTASRLRISVELWEKKKTDSVNCRENIRVKEVKLWM